VLSDHVLVDEQQGRGGRVREDHLADVEALHRLTGVGPDGARRDDAAAEPFRDGLDAAVEEHPTQLDGEGDRPRGPVAGGIPDGHWVASDANPSVGFDRRPHDAAWPIRPW
jgi:hypothetical protein